MGLRFIALFLLSLSCFASEQWTEVKSPHFTVITDAGEKRGREVALRFEQMRGYFGKLIGGEIHTPHEIQILAFKNSKGLRQVSPIFKGKVVELAGLYQKGQAEDFIGLDLSSEGDYKWETVFHEYAHLLLNANTAQYPPWFDEGFAEFFSTIDFSGKDALVGRPPSGAAEMLGSNRLVPVAQLFAVRHDSATYNESGDHRSMFYAESWLITHFTYDKNLRPSLGKYLAELGDRPPNEELFRKYMGMSFRDFDRGLEGYVRGNKISGYRAPLPETIDMSSFSARPLTDNDALIAVANMHANERDHQEQSIDEFKQALERDPNNAKAQSALGYVYLMRRDYKTAEPYLERAAAGGSSDPMVHYYYAMLIQMSGSAREKLDRQQKELEAAIKLNPSLAEAYDLLGINARQRNDLGAAIVAGSRAVMLDRRNDVYALNLAGYLLSAKKVEEAQPLLARLEKSDNPHVQAQLPAMEAYSAQMRTVAAAAAGNTEMTIPRQPEKALPVLEMKATLLQVDCKDDDRAVVYLLREHEQKMTILQVPSIDDVELNGEKQDAFCSLKNRSVTAAYTDNGQLFGLKFTH
ncbi:MAG: tetratricopeptide repeat protein [Acidobacteriales bacterium]|nr:tetratricopeptide repeat protein [Terriglobales bacterium]